MSLTVKKAKKEFHKYVFCWNDVPDGEPPEVMIDTMDGFEFLEEIEPWVSNELTTLSVYKDENRCVLEFHDSRVNEPTEVMLDTHDAHEMIESISDWFDDLVSLKIYDVSKSGKKLNTIHNIVLDGLL